TGKPGPVYLDLPGDVLYGDVDESTVHWPRPAEQRDTPRGAAAQDVVERVVDKLRAAQRPVVITGSGILWSGAAAALQTFVEATGIPFYTTPQGRGVIPEDHPFFFGHARSTAFKEADFVLVVGTRLNYVYSYGKPPRFSEDATFVRIDTDPDEIAASERVHIGIVGDARTVLEQLTAEASGQVAS